MKTIVERLEEKLVEKGYEEIELVDEFIDFKTKRIVTYVFSATKEGKNIELELDKTVKDCFQLWKRKDEESTELIDEINIKL